MPGRPLPTMPIVGQTTSSAHQCVSCLSHQEAWHGSFGMLFPTHSPSHSLPPSEPCSGPYSPLEKVELLFPSQNSTSLQLQPLLSLSSQMKLPEEALHLTIHCLFSPAPRLDHLIKKLPPYLEKEMLWYQGKESPGERA